MIEIPHGLKEAIEADDLVLFIGAGLSWNLKNTENEPLEGWDKMVKSILSHLQEKGRIKKEVKQYCDGLEPIKALEILEKNEGITKNEIGEFVKHYFTLRNKRGLSLQKKLFSLSTKIITTNYDIAFEGAVRELEREKAYKTQDRKLSRLVNDPVFLFKLHGCIKDPKSMVLFPSDYEELYNDKGRESALALLAFKFLIFSKTFLFIGTGLDDHQINSIFKEIKEIRGVYNQEHYIITLDSLDNSLLNFLTPIPVGSYTKIPKVIKQLIEIKQAAEANKSSEKKKLLDQFKEVKERNISLTKELDKEKDKNKRQALLLEREANNHFNIGVKYHLAGEYLEASKEYEAATELNPKDSEAYNNWGLALCNLAQKKSGIEAEVLYNESFEKYRQAIRIKRDYHEAYYNWGVALSDLAQSKSGIEAEGLYNESFEKYRQAIRIKRDCHEAYNNWGNALSRLAQSKSGIEAEALYNESFEKYRQAIRIKPDYHEAYNNWGLVLYNLAQTKSGDAAENLYKEACAKYEKATQYKPNNYEAYNNWGLVLYNLAQTKSGDAAENLYNEAFAKYEKATLYKPDFPGAYNNWGNALSRLAQSKSGIEAEALYNESFKKYRQAIRIKPDYHDAYYNWGNDLHRLVQIKSGVEAEVLYNESFEKYRQAIRIKPDDYEVYYNWGVALSCLAQSKSGIEAEALYNESFEKYRQAIRIKPDYHKAYYNWGVALSRLAQSKSGIEAENLYDEAAEKYQQAINNGGYVYNLACLYAIRNKKEEALKYLERSLERGEISVDFVEKDIDWDGLRDDSDFKNLLSRYKKDNKNAIL